MLKCLRVNIYKSGNLNLLSKMQVGWLREKVSLNEVQLRNTMDKWSSKRMTKPKLQNLWNNLNESYSPTYFLQTLQGQRSAAQVLILVLNSLREAEFFIELGRRSHNLGAREERLRAVINSMISSSF